MNSHMQSDSERILPMNNQLTKSELGNMNYINTWVYVHTIEMLLNQLEVDRSTTIVIEFSKPNFGLFKSDINDYITEEKDEKEFNFLKSGRKFIVKCLDFRYKHDHFGIELIKDEK